MPLLFQHRMAQLTRWPPIQRRSLWTLTVTLLHSYIRQVTASVGWPRLKAG